MKQTTINRYRNNVVKPILALTLLFLTSIFVQSCKKEKASPLESEEFVKLNTKMHSLCSDHMQWTYATVDAFFHNQDQLQANLTRLLQNQKDLGAAIVPYYGQAAGDKLAALLTTHIQDAVPVLQAAKDGNQAALSSALDEWYANAQEIADFLSSANPDHWPQNDMRDMMKGHITQTTTYSVDLLQGNYTKAVEDFGVANEHMMMMADMLSEGIAKQFSEKF